VNLALHNIARQFIAGQSSINISPLGNGLINTTFLVQADNTALVLQRINQHVFPNPEQLTANLQQLNRHIRGRAVDNVRLQIPDLLLTCDQKPFFLDTDGQFWRALELIHPAESREQLKHPSEAQQIGYALAHFHRLCSDLPTQSLHDTLPGFHITPGYYQHHQALRHKPLSIQPNSRYQYCLSFIDNFQDKIYALERAKQQGILIERVIHGDPKFNNFLFQPDSNHIISLIDLDTVKPGLVHYDIGDCLRSCCHIQHGNQFNLDNCHTILSSYLEEAGQFFTSADYEYLYPAIELIPFELGLRFFNDYLEGNRYFKVNDPEQNLHRSIAQFQLCQSIAEQQEQIDRIIKSLMAKNQRNTWKGFLPQSRT